MRDFTILKIIHLKFRLTVRYMLDEESARCSWYAPSPSPRSCARSSRRNEISLVAGTQFRGQFEQRVKGLLSEVKAAWAVCQSIRARQHAGELLQEESAQGTTEYAILVGVLVVIAIIAIVAFKGKVQDLWNAIREGINSL